MDMDQLVQQLRDFEQYTFTTGDVLYFVNNFLTYIRQEAPLSLSEEDGSQEQFLQVAEQLLAVYDHTKKDPVARDLDLAVNVLVLRQLYQEQPDSPEFRQALANFHQWPGFESRPGKDQSNRKDQLEHAFGGEKYRLPEDVEAPDQ